MVHMSVLTQRHKQPTNLMLLFELRDKTGSKGNMLAQEEHRNWQPSESA